MFWKKFLVASMSTFVRNPLLKSASELEKMKKIDFVFNFHKMILESIYYH